MTLFSGLAAALVAAASALTPAATHAPIGSADAVSIAEKHAPGRAIGVELEYNRNGSQFYEVEMSDAGKMRTIAVDAKSGAVLAQSQSRVKSLWSRWTDREENAAIGQARPLGSVLAALEQRSGGRVTEASFDVEAGQPRYEVELATDLGTTQVYLDPATGDRLSMVMDD